MPKGKLKIVILLIFISILIILSISLILIKQNTKEIHIHAGFVVFENNKQVDFSDFKYMKITPCNTNENHEELIDEQLEKAHLHDQVGDVVHIHRENAKWRDLFRNINYDIDYNSITAYLNGKKITDLKSQKISPYDSLVVLIGENDEKEAISKSVNKSHILEIEKRSENCAT